MRTISVLSCFSVVWNWSILSISSIHFYLDSHHYNNVIMGAMASQTTSLTIIYSTVCRAQIKEKIKAPRRWPLCGEFTGVNSPHKWPVTRKNVSIWWRHHGPILSISSLHFYLGRHTNAPEPSQENSAFKTLCGRIHLWPIDSHKGPLMRKAFPCHVVVMMYWLFITDLPQKLHDNCHSRFPT